MWPLFLLCWGGGCDGSSKNSLKLNCSFVELANGKYQIPIFAPNQLPIFYPKFFEVFGFSIVSKHPMWFMIQKRLKVNYLHGAI